MRTAEHTLQKSQGARAIRINLAFPVTRVGFGFFSFDPITQALGAPLAEILSSLMVAPVYRRPSQAGPAVDVYPLALPEGEGASLHLGHLGDVGFTNDRGWLVITVPLPTSGWVQQRLAHLIVHGPEAGLSTDGTSRVAHFWLHLVPGTAATLPLGALGELSLEAA